MKKSRSLGILHILNDGYLASLPLLLPFIQKDLNIEFDKIGLLSSLLSSAAVVLALFAPFISALLGGYRVLLLSILFYSSAFSIVGLSPGFYSLAFAFIIASVGFGLFHPISFALIANDADDADIGARMGSFTAVGDIGKIGIAAGVTALVSLVNWRTTAFIYGAFPLVFIAIILLFGRKARYATVSKKEKAPKVHGLRYSAEYITAILTSFIDSLASSSLFIFIPFLFVFRGASTSLLGSLSGAFFIGNMLGKVLIGKVTDKIGCRKVFVVSEIAMSAILIVLSLLHSIVLIAITSVLLGVVTKGTVPVINTLVAKAVPDRRLNEKAFGIVSFVNGIAAVIAPLLFGFVAQRLDITSVFRLSACFAFFAVFPLLMRKLIHRGAAA